MNVYGDQLKNCSGPGTALTGFLRDGTCSFNKSDSGSHNVCLKNMRTSEFCDVTGQYNWCDKSYTCHEDKSKSCKIKNWCICQWAFASLVEQKGCVDEIELKCDAINANVIKDYSLQNTVVSLDALSCIKRKCNL